MAKEIIAISIIVFWLSFPFAMILQNSSDYIPLDTEELQYLKSPDEIGINSVNILNSLTFWDYVSIYFKAMYQTIPNSPPYVTLLIIIMQVITALIIYLLIRGG